MEYKCEETQEEAHLCQYYINQGDRDGGSHRDFTFSREKVFACVVNHQNPVYETKNKLRKID